MALFSVFVDESIRQGLHDAGSVLLIFLFLPLFLFQFRGIVYEALKTAYFCVSLLWT